MDDQQPGDEYTLEEAVAILDRVVARKRAEIDDLVRRGARLRKEDRKRANEQLVAYLTADVNAYVSVIADMTDDDGLLEGIDPDGEPVEVPEDYQDYLDSLDVDDLQDEMDADGIRADYCDGVIEAMCTDIGEAALNSKKMVKAMLDDPYALEQIGEVIFYDDYLYDLFKTLSQEGDGGKGKKKKKKK